MTDTSTIGYTELCRCNDPAVIDIDTESLATLVGRIGEILIAKAAERMYVPFC